MKNRLALLASLPLVGGVVGSSFAAVDPAITAGFTSVSTDAATLATGAAGVMVIVALACVGIALGRKFIAKGK